MYVTDLFLQRHTLRIVPPPKHSHLARIVCTNLISIYRYQMKSKWKPWHMTTVSKFHHQMCFLLNHIKTFDNLGHLVKTCQIPLFQPLIMKLLSWLMYLKVLGFLQSLIHSYRVSSNFVRPCNISQKVDFVLLLQYYLNTN